ncbi:hypothetical protein VPH35_018297 [Triticum aestivum]
MTHFLLQRLLSFLRSYLILLDDVWPGSILDSIIKVLPNNRGSKIIVTTRFEAVAASFIREADNPICEVKGLLDEESRELFERTLFESSGREHVTKRFEAAATTSKRKGSEDVMVPDKVWKMCKGLPLAIVTMAGHVACNPSKSGEEWSNLCSYLFLESVKDGRQQQLTQAEVGRIVSHCFNDMPAEIKICALYLSIFPLGNKISTKRLMRRWIVEGLISEREDLSVENVAVAYFNHLIRRQVIQPVEYNSNGNVKQCVVYRMFLEYIVAKASEDNFITVAGGTWRTQLSRSKVRQMSLQGCDSSNAKEMEKMDLSHVRSLTMFGSLNQLPSHLFKFRIVHTLDLEGCTGFQVCHTDKICKMLLLKYLGLRRTDTKRLPDTIGNLKNLETLDIRETNIAELPETVCQLERLVNIFGGDKRTKRPLRLPEGLIKKRKMKALRILTGIEIVGGWVDLYHLTELRKLAIYKLNTMSSKDLSSYIGHLGGCSIQTLIIYDESSNFLESLYHLSRAPMLLVALELTCKMVKIPGWIAELAVLKKLTLSVTALRTDNLKYLSNLSLFSLTFRAAESQHPETHAIVVKNKLCSGGVITVPDEGFKNLKVFRISALRMPLLKFSRYAMPELETLELNFSMLEGVLGTENLVRLEMVHLRLMDKEGGEDQTKDVQKEMEEAVEKRTDGKAPRVILHGRLVETKPKL